MRLCCCKILLVCVVVITSFEGCISEDIISAEGYIFDATTKQPLNGVLVKSFVVDKKKSLAREMTTDSTGFFHATTGLVGCVGDCPDLLVEFSKDGYVTLEMTEHTYQDTLYLER